MSESRPASDVVTGPSPRRLEKRRAMGFGPLIRLRFGPGVLTDRLFTVLSSRNHELRMERTARGDLELMTPAGSEGSSKNGRLTYRLVHWAENEGRGLGVVFDSSGGFTLPNGAIRSPDASWVASPRWEALTTAQREVFAPLCPDFVVELRSSSDKPSTLREKMAEYVQQGARLGWLIDPLRGTVEVYRPGRPVEALVRPATLPGEDVLPGFVLDLKGILFD